MSLNAAEQDLFGQSIKRCLANPRFLDRFYERFLASSEEVRRHFSNTNFGHQKIMLKLSLVVIQQMSGGRVPAGGAMEKLAKSHGREGRAVKPELYDLWLDCMVAAAHDIDPQFDAEQERLWREGMAPGIAYMQQHY